MSNILNSEDFGLKIYNRFPPKYREDDVGQDYALKRYIEASSDGGFKYAIDDINGITYLINPDKVESKILPILFKQYGLELFNGIPEEYLRYLLPKLGEAWSKKGSLGVIEFITSSLSGIKTSTDVSYDDQDNPLVEVTFEMDYNIGDYFPNTRQFEKLLVNFLPFYCDVAILYAYMFYETQILVARDEEYLETYIKDIKDVHGNLDCADDLLDTLKESTFLESCTMSRSSIERRIAVFGKGVFGEAIFSDTGYSADTHVDNITFTTQEEIGLHNIIDSTIEYNYNNSKGCVYIKAVSYDIITLGKELTVAIH